LFLKVFKKDKPMNHSTRNLNYEIQ
jgi:hypothetical protein